jgi:Fungal Zn(2)-Cys(6) binuclear cluster domain
MAGHPLHSDHFPMTPRSINSQSQEAPFREDQAKHSPNISVTVSPKSQRIGVPGETSKPKRVRTGCLTCRERHLKCDEALPRCQNCHKSDRVCKRGVRLNFIDTQTIAPPFNIVHPPGTQLSFQDESREIASEYIGGFERYPPLDLSSSTGRDGSMQFEYSEVLNDAPMIPRTTAPASPSFLPSFSEPPFAEASQAEMAEPTFIDNSYSATNSTYTEHSSLSQPSFNISKSPTQASSVRPFLNNAEEVLLMQVFVEEVGLWMDSMDASKHVGLPGSRLELFLMSPVHPYITLSRTRRTYAPELILSMWSSTPSTCQSVLPGGESSSLL